MGDRVPMNESQALTPIAENKRWTMPVCQFAPHNPVSTGIAYGQHPPRDEPVLSLMINEFRGFISTTALSRDESAAMLALINPIVASLQARVLACGQRSRPPARAGLCCTPTPCATSTATPKCPAARYSTLK
jgi:hypothetical protein